MPVKKDNEAIERKLRQIYDACDVRNFKLALKLTTAGLQKHPENQTMKVLKAVALERTGKPEEANKVVDELLAAGPTDDHVLQTMALVLKPAGRLQDLAEGYEKACQKDPKNEDMLRGYFHSVIRLFDFVRQQQVVLKLQKHFPSEQHQWWLVNTLLLQARAADSGQTSALGADKLLQLSASMMLRLLQQAGPGGPSREGLVLYVGVLQAQGKHAEALEVLRGPLGAAISLPAERQEAEGALLQGTGAPTEAAAVYLSALNDQPDDWAHLIRYLDCLIPVPGAGGLARAPSSSSAAVAQLLQGRPLAILGGDEEQPCQTGTPPPPEVVAEVEAALASLPAVAPSSSGSSSPQPLLRGPALAQVEMVWRKLQLGLATEEELAAAVLSYHDKLGHMVSCAMDLRTYLPAITGAAAIWLANALKLRTQEEEPCSGAQQQQEVKQLRRLVSAHQVQWELGLPEHVNPSEALAHAQALMQLYTSKQHLYEGLDERERGPADELVLLAASFIVRADQQQQHRQRQQGNPQEPTFLLQALLLLEAGVRQQPFSAPCRLALCWLYGMLGCSRAAQKHFQVLDTKHIQMDTVASHHLLPLLRALGANTAAAPVLAASRALVEDHLQDAGDTLWMAYKHDTHTKVLEFVAFKERLQHSHSYAAAVAESAIQQAQAAAGVAGTQEALPKALHQILSSSCKASGLDQLSPKGSQRMRFNADLTTRVLWMPPCPAPPHLTVLWWWEQHLQPAAAAGRQGGRTWWQAVAAAESSSPEAAAYRESLRGAVQQRWLLPHLLAAALGQPGAALPPGAAAAVSASPAAAADDDPHQRLVELLPGFAKALGLNPDSVDAALESASPSRSSSSSSSSSLSSSRKLQLMELGLWALAEGVQELLSLLQGEPSRPAVLGSTSFSIQQRSQWLGRALEVLQLQLAPHLQPQGLGLGLVPGEAMAQVLVLVNETGLWMVACLEAWCASWRDLKKKSKKATAAGALLKDRPVEQALAAVAALQTTLSELLAAISDGCSQVLLVPQEERLQQLLSQLDPGSSSVMQGLVVWEQQLPVQVLLKELLAEQGQVVKDVGSKARQMGSRLDKLQWL